jgi:hypothetical protein
MELMRAQTCAAPAPLTRSEIISLSEQVGSGLEELAGSDVPNALGHFDFNPGNIVISEKQCIFLDWAEGYVGHPFITFEYLVQHVRRFHGAPIDTTRTLVPSYASRWQSFVSPKEIEKDLALVPLLALFAYATAVSQRSSEVFERPATAGYLRSFGRRMKREADSLRERNFTCVH